MKRLGFFALAAALFAFVACETTAPQVKDAAPAADTTGIWVKASNEQLSKVPVKGFEYKNSAVPAQSWDKWAVAAAPVIKGIVDKLPEGYVLVIKGHTDARGPEEPTGNKPGNLKISSDRAKSVLASLKKQGITSSKIITKGAGSSEPLSGIDSKDAGQRRVTFEVAPK
jgi:hypothetical protein